jgi:deoxyribonuclease V
MIAFLDVDYRGTGARAACVVLKSWTDQTPSATFTADVEGVHSYEPGNFYLRELPCLMSVLGLLPEMPETLVVDGYVWLGPERRPGLGAHLHEAVGGLGSVVGIAKTKFGGLSDSDLVALVYRGQSKNPLFITSVGMDLDGAAEAVRGMHGEHRIPEIVRMTDRLARSPAAVWQTMLDEAEGPAG